MADLIERLLTRLAAERAAPETGHNAADRERSELIHLLRETADALEAAREDAARLDFIERTYSGMTNRERYLPVQMIWGKGCNGRTLREACDKYMEREDRNG